MNQFFTKHIIQETERKLEAILGNEFYEELKEFFRQFILKTEVDKILITRRAYVLYKIFYKIFSVSEAQKYKDVKDAIKNGNASKCVYTTHSVPLLLRKSEKKPLLIVDDVIVNGRTIDRVIEKFKKVDEDWKITLWCLRCNEKAAYYEQLSNYLTHVIFVTPYEWEIISDRLTDAVVMSNIGYVSFLKTYWLSNDAYDEIFRHLSLIQCNQKSYTIETRSIGNEGKYTLKCHYFLFDNNNVQNGNKYPMAIRLYKTDESNLIIPYVYLPSLTSGQLFRLCGDMMLKHSKNNESQSNNMTKFIEMLVQDYNGQNEEMFCDSDIGILAYQSIVNFLSDCYLKKVLFDCLKNDFSAQIDLCFDPMESFPVQKISADSTNENIGESRPEKWNQVFEEIKFCKRILLSVKQETDSFLDSMKKYFAKVREEDDRRATREEDRLYGISIKDIMDCFATVGSTNSGTLTSKFYLDLLYLWDTGVASCVILATWNQEKNCSEFSEFIRHGEQAFRAIYSIYPDEYSVLRRFAEISDFYSEREILSFARYYERYSGSCKILYLAEKIEFATFFADCMAISPESVGAKLDKKEIDKIVKIYLSYI